LEVGERVLGFLVFFVLVDDRGFAVGVVLLVLGWVLVMLMERKSVLLGLSCVNVEIFPQMACVGNVIYAFDVDV
jgi:hypothetical protein